MISNLPMRIKKRRSARGSFYKNSNPAALARYAAAKTDRLTGDWNPADWSMNDLLKMHGSKLRARVRQLIRDFPIFTRAVNVSLDHVVGEGFRFQSHAKSAGGKADNPMAQKIEDGWRFFADQADITRKLDIYGLMRLQKRQDLECGESLFIKRYVPEQRDRFIPFCLQPIEPDLLTDMDTAKVEKGHEIEQGVEYEKSTGIVTHYHFYDPDSWGKVDRVPAQYVIHGYDYLRAGQRRGVSPLVSGVLVARDLGEYIGAEIDTAKMAAKYLAFVTKDAATRGSVITKNEDDKYIDEMENAIVEYLNPGETIEIAHSNRPGGNFPPTVKLMICMLAAATGVPYELLSFDYSGINYSSTRVIRNDFKHQIRPTMARCVREFCMPVAIEFLNYAVLTGKVKLPNYETNPWPFRRFVWQGPGAEMIDPLKESKSNISELGVGLRSPQEIALARGRDYEEILTEIASAVEMLKDKGLEFLIPIMFQSNSLSTANNPAAVEEQDNNGNGNGNGKRTLAGANIGPDVMDALADLADNIETLISQ